jgi:hypothetical protein
MVLMNVFDELEREVQRQADELTPELLPLILERMLARNTVTGCCERHDKHLLPYVTSQVLLTRAKRRAENKQEKEKLLAILAEKQDGKLSELSEKELRRRIAALEE